MGSLVDSCASMLRLFFVSSVPRFAMPWKVSRVIARERASLWMTLTATTAGFGPFCSSSPVASAAFCFVLWALEFFCMNFVLLVQFSPSFPLLPVPASCLMCAVWAITSACRYTTWHPLVADDFHIEAGGSKNWVGQKSWDKSAAWKNWGPEYWDRSVSNTRKNSGKCLSKPYHRRYGGNWKSWCRHALRPIKDTLRLRFSWKHCRLGSWRWRITKKMLASPLYAYGRGENYGWFFSKTHSFRETRSKINTEKRGKCTKYSSWSL